MFSTFITIRNPFRTGDEAMARDVFVLDTQLTRNKNLEIQISRWSRIINLFEFELETRFSGRDHAGPRIYISLLGFFACVQVYDHRHWDYEKGTWETT